MTTKFWEKQPGEQKPAGPKPQAVKLKSRFGPRKVGCPAYPTSGAVVGAGVDWCRRSRGAMDACKSCDWRNA